MLILMIGINIIHSSYVLIIVPLIVVNDHNNLDLTNEFNLDLH